MTKSTITREQLIEKLKHRIAVTEKYPHLEEAQIDSQIFKIALAAMDSEPVAWLLSGGGAKNVVCFDSGNAYADPLREVTPLYRHAQPTVDSEPVGYFRRYDPDFDALITQCDKGAQDSFPLYLHAQSAKGFESAGWQFKSVNGDWLGLIGEHGKNQAVREGCEVREVFAMDDGVNERDHVRREHAEWSQATFGNVGPVGPLKHLSKEALEAAAEPGDLSEWADMQFLLWDAQRRAGITDEQITQAMIEKLAVNKQREWPEPKEGEPRMHIKAQPAPVVEADDNFYSWFGREWQENYQHNQYTTAAKQVLGVMAESAWIAATERQRQKQSVSVPDVKIYEDVPYEVGRFKTHRDCYCDGWNDFRAAMLQAGNSPVIPDGYVMVPKEATLDMLKAGAKQDMKGEAFQYVWQAMLAAAPQSPGSEPATVPGKWIPVSERLPAVGHKILAYRPDAPESDDPLIRVATYVGKSAHGHGFDCYCKPTHWMPLPAAPQPEVK